MPGRVLVTGASGFVGSGFETCPPSSFSEIEATARSSSVLKRGVMLFTRNRNLSPGRCHGVVRLPDMQQPDI